MEELKWKSLIEFRMEINKALSKKAKEILTNTNLSRAGPHISEKEKEINKLREEYLRLVSTSSVARLERNIKGGYPVSDEEIEEIIKVTPKEKEEIVKCLNTKAEKLSPVLETLKRRKKERKKMDREAKHEMEREKEEFERKFE